MTFTGLRHNIGNEVRLDIKAIHQTSTFYYQTSGNEVRLDIKAMGQAPTFYYQTSAFQVVVWCHLPVSRCWKFLICGFETWECIALSIKSLSKQDLCSKFTGNHKTIHWYGFRIFIFPIRNTALLHGPLTRYIKLRVAHAPGMPGTFSLPSTSKETAD